MAGVINVRRFGARFVPQFWEARVAANIDVVGSGLMEPVAATQTAAAAFGTWDEPTGVFTFTAAGLCMVKYYGRSRTDGTFTPTTPVSSGQITTGFQMITAGSQVVQINPQAKENFGIVPVGESIATGVNRTWNCGELMLNFAVGDTITFTRTVSYSPDGFAPTINRLEANTRLSITRLTQA